MTFEVEVNGRLRRVSVERAGSGRFLVTLDGIVHEVDAARTGEHALSVIFDREGGISRELQIAPAGPPGELLVGIEGRTVAVSVNTRRSRRSAPDAGAGLDGEQAVTAPMPGRIIRILVAAGDEVAARQALIVVEAMKMENELRSPRAGRVKLVTVTAGTSVESGRVLVVIE
ncbi:MAG: biotin/lipoyl-containing protein [Acidobacteriota bacterium]